MDELEKKAQKGLESFNKKREMHAVKASLDGLIDDMLGEDEEVSINKESKGPNLKWLYIALAILGMGIIGYLGFKDAKQQNKIEEPQALYAQYFEVLSDATSANERGSNTNSDLENDANLGMDYYNKGEFEKAAAILKLQDKVGFRVFGAIAEMKNNNIESALKLLTSSKNLEASNQYTDIIDWYLSLAYLRQGDIDNAKKNLKMIAIGSHYKKEEAKSILELLN